MTAPPDPKRQTRIGSAARAALQLLACCPRMPTDALSVLLGHREPVTTAQLLARIRRAGLAQYQVRKLGPFMGSRPVRLWTLSGAGRRFVARRHLAVEAVDDASDGLYGRPEIWRDPARQRGVPMLVDCYRLLAEVARDLGQPVRVYAWEHPWVRTVSSSGGARGRRVTLPAAAVLQSRLAGDRRPLRLLLLPDAGTAPLASYRPALKALIDLRRTALNDEADEPLLIIGVAISPRTSTARVEAWQSLLLELAHRSDDRLLLALVLKMAYSLGGHHEDRRTRSQADEIFAMVARHPLLTREQLASLLRTSTGRIVNLEAELMERGWLCRVPGDNLSPDAADQIHRFGLVELTATGRREAARRLLIPGGLAGRRHGVVHTGAGSRRYLRHLHHTLGANAFFVDLATAATRATSRGGDEALVEWRSAAACAYGRFRPDGYGCYRRGSWQFGFFLEYDRGTERSLHYAAKLATYYQYRASAAYKRDYQSFPSLLIVTTDDRAEGRLAHQAYLAHQRFGGTPLSLYLTTTTWIEVCPEGALGPIWRSRADPWAAEPARICWLPQPGCSPRPDFPRAGKTMAECGRM